MSPNLSSIFNTVDHATLLRRLNVTYDLGGVVNWFTSYLDGRTQSVRCGRDSSKTLPLLFGVPEGSVPYWSILFLLHTADLVRLTEIRNFHQHLYSDDAQIYGFCCPDVKDELQGRLFDCDNEVALWMRSNWLQLNASKTSALVLVGSPPVSDSNGSDYDWLD